MEFLDSFIIFSNNFLSIKLFNNIEIFHIFYFIIFVRIIHKIFKVVGG